MSNALEMTSDAAREFVLGGEAGVIRVRGMLDLRGVEINEIKATITCHDLDASDSKLRALPGDLRVTSRLILDRCAELEQLPAGLSCGSISLRNCDYLSSLPEEFNTWFLDLTDCKRFSTWPEIGTIQRGALCLRNCIELQSLPPWLGLLGQLDLAGCIQLVDVPEGVQVTSWIDVGGTNISSLPSSLSQVALRWRGVPVDERIAFRPDELTAKEALNESNAEARRVMIERMGYLRFAQEAKAKVIDRDEDAGGSRQLLRIPLEDDEPLVGLSCFCPSTQRQYFLRVPPAMKTCHQAAAWMAGFDDPDLYKPIIET